MASAGMRIVQTLDIPVMQDTDIRSFRTLLHMPRTVFARLIGRTERALSDWETGKKKP
jgi:DNA-binding transcriptional regulator YiaG